MILIAAVVSAAATLGPETFLAVLGGYGALPLPEPSNLAMACTGALFVAFACARRAQSGK